MAQLVFSADDGNSGRELWTTDGTAEGTRLLADIWPGGGGSGAIGSGPFGPDNFLPLADGRALFAATDPFHGSEPWVTDGTAEGTRLVADINRGEAGFSGSSPSGFAALGGGRAIFAANDGVHGFEPWVTDGTEEGTRLVADLQPGPGFGPGFGPFVTIGGGRAIFRNFDSASGGEPWVTDGSAEGTRRIADISPGEAWSLGPGSFSALDDGRALFWANDGVHGFEPWVTDGTAEGTRLVADILPGSAASLPGPYDFSLIDGGRALFWADDGVRGREPWVTDGTAAGTRLVADILPGAGPGPGPSGPSPSGFFAVGDGRAVFWTSDGTHGSEPWVTDGTAEGTRLVADIWPGGGGISSSSSSVSGPPGGTGGLVALGDGRVLFSARDPIHGTELWVSDLTAEGTRLAGDINTALQGFASGSPSVFAALDVGRAVFSADDGVHGREAWVSDGTPEGTRLIADIFAGAPASGAGGSPFGGPSGPPLGPIGFAPVSPPPDWAM